MLAMSARVSPCMARAVRWSESRVIVRMLFSMVAAIPAGTGWLSLPLGPSALIRWPSICTLTPCGIGMGCLPMRDMVVSLPDVGEHFAAHVLFPGVAVGHHAPGRRDQSHAHPAEDRGDLVVGDVDPAARRGHAHQAGDDLLVAGAVLEVHAQRPLLRVFQ